MPGIGPTGWSPLCKPSRAGSFPESNQLPLLAQLQPQPGLEAQALHCAIHLVPLLGFRSTGPTLLWTWTQKNPRAGLGHRTSPSLASDDGYQAKLHLGQAPAPSMHRWGASAPVKTADPAHTTAASPVADHKWLDLTTVQIASARPALGCAVEHLACVGHVQPQICPGACNSCEHSVNRLCCLS
jgi:hypothetical protein